MKIFGKKEVKKVCSCGNDCSPLSMEETTIQNTKEGIKVLGSGCAKCESLELAVKKALTELEMDMNIEHISDFVKIANYGVISTPALVVNGEVVSYGKVLTVEEVKKILQEIK